jgi:hypothetical protein
VWWLNIDIQISGSRQDWSACVPAVALPLLLQSIRGVYLKLIYVDELVRGAALLSAAGRDSS